MESNAVTRKTSGAPTPDDHMVVKKVQKGDRNAFDELVKRYYGAVYNLTAHSVHSAEEREDMIQEIFLKAYRNIGGFRFESAFSTWLYSIARNMLIDRSRKRKPVEVSMEKEEGGVKIGDSVHDTRNDPEKWILERDADKTLRAALMSLDEDYKQILILREMEGLSYLELSRVLNLNIGTVKSRLARARDDLRIKLTEQFPG